MPTENRSSNTELRKIVTEALVGMVSGVTGMKPPADEPLPGFIQAPIDRAVTRISDLLAQPAPQPHPEPIAWQVGTAFWWNKEEAERDAAAMGLPIVGLGPMTGIAPAEQHQVEPVGEVVAFGKGLHEIAWSAGRMPKLGAKLYTHADPGEVERLRTQVNEWAGKWEKAISAGAVMEGERNTLRAQLAERDALLRDFCGHSALICGDLLRLAREDDFATTDPIRTRAYSAMDHARKVKKTLSASAEPSACEHDWVDARNEHVLSGELCAKCHAIRAGNSAAEPSVPVEHDERAAFEKAVIDKAERFHPNLEQYGEHPDAEYRDASIEWAWRLWQARAALERKPQVKS